MVSRLIACVVLAAVSASPAFAQQFDRRARDEPEVVVEPGGRVGTADVVRFSPDGQFLFAAGDDKVVRVWPHSATGLDTAPGRARVLRWRSWRDQLGGIKTISISPDGKRVAVGGYGLRISTVAILDRDSGDTLAITWPRAPEGTSHFDAVMAVEFHPDGKRVGFGTADGTLWFWDPVKLGKPEGDRVWNAPVRAGRFAKIAAEFNFPRGIRFPDADTMVAVSQRGQVLACDLRAALTDDPTAPIPPGTTLFNTDDGQSQKLGVDKVAWTGDGKWFVVSTTGPMVLVRSMDGKQVVPLELPPDHFARSLAVHPKTGRVAIGVASALPALENGPRFYLERDDRIWLWDALGEKKPVPSVLAHTGRAEALGFHPTDDRLAVAGGDADEVTLLDLAEPNKPKSVVRGVGRRLHAVNLSESGDTIGVQIGRNVTSHDPNNRGAGPWVRFHLPRMSATSDNEKWVGVVRTLGGWTVVPDTRSRFVWHVARKHADGTAEQYRLLLDADVDQAPTCFTFVPAQDGKPVRVLVGHYYGCSLFELDAARARKNPRTGDLELPRVKLFTGHGAEVNSVVADRTGTWFVTAGADQTVAGWSLADWDSEPALGASFGVQGGQLFVTAVDTGSPAWEAGLSKGDRVERLAIDAKVVYDGRTGKAFGTADAAATLLAHPQPGVEHYFGWVTPGQNERRATPTRLKQRPLWKWFPAFDAHGKLTDSILWMWHGSYYYTASLHGDRFVGWHVNDAEVARSPTFQPLERYKHVYLRPDVLSTLIETRSVAMALKEALGENPQRKIFRSVEADPVELALKQSVVRGNAVGVTVAVNPSGRNPDLLPHWAELWVNDHRFKVWTGLDAHSFTEEVTIPATAFRAGDNQITLLALNPLRGRAEVTRFVHNPRAAEHPALLGVAAGVDDYSAHRKAVGGVRAFDDLNKATADATGIAKGFLAHRGKGHYFPTGDLTVLVNAKAGRAGLTEALHTIRTASVKPDDLLVVFLAGHGDLLSPDGEPLPAPVAGGNLAARGFPLDAGRFVFCCPDYVPARAAQTALSAEELFDALAEVNCRKLVLLDACHAGGVTQANILRRCIPNGRGPIVIAACRQNEVSYDDEALGNGVFTREVIDALGKGYRAADADTDGNLTAAELFDYVAERVPEQVRKLRPGKTQNPICYPHPSELAKVTLVRQ